MESKKRLMVVLDLDEDNNAEVVFTKELIQSKEGFEVEIQKIKKNSLRCFY